MAIVETENHLTEHRLKENKHY